MSQRAQVNVTLNGTPEQIRTAYQTICDVLTDGTDIDSLSFPEWSCHMAFDLDEDWRKPADRAEQAEFLNVGLEDYGTLGLPDYSDPWTLEALEGAPQ